MKAVWGQLPVWKAHALEEFLCYFYLFNGKGLLLLSGSGLCFPSANSHSAMAPGWGGLHSHRLSCSTRLEMGKWMEDLNMAIEMAKKSTEKSGMLLENSVCSRSNSKWCFLLSWKASVVMSFSFFLLWIWWHRWSVFIIHMVMESYLLLFCFNQNKCACLPRLMFLVALNAAEMLQLQNC